MKTLFFQLALLCSMSLSCVAMQSQNVQEKLVEDARLKTGVVSYVHLLCSQSKTAELTEVLSTNPVLTAQDKHEALKITCMTGHAFTALLLWEKFGFRFIEKDRYTALELALVHEQKAVIEYFLLQDSTLSPHQLLRDAVRLKKDDMALWLMGEKKADPANKDHRPFHYSAVHIAAMHNPSFLDVLLQGVKPVDEKNMSLRDFDLLFSRSQWGTSPFHAAAAWGKLASIHKFLALKFPLNRLDDIGNTALMRATRGAHMEVAEALVAAGADITHANGRGFTALTHERDENVDEKKHLALLGYLKKQLEVRQQAKTQGLQKP